MATWKNILDWFNGLRRRLRFIYCSYKARCIVSRARAAAPPEFDPVCIGEAIWTFSGGGEDVMESIFGKKPEVVPFQDVDLQQEQLDALMGNIEAWPEIEKLGGLYQKYMIGSYEKAFPGFQSLLGLGGETTRQMFELSKEMMGGELPKDVADYVRRSTAYKSLMSGTSGGAMAGALEARDLGLTSLDLMEKGANMATVGGNALQRFTGIAANTIMSPAGWVITPAQQAEMTLTNRLIQHNIAQQKANVEAQPVPWAKGLSDIVANLTGAYLGGMSGGSGGGGGIAPQYTGTQSTQMAGGATAGSIGGPTGGMAGGIWGGWGAQGMSVAPAPSTNVQYNYLPTSATDISANFGWNPGGSATNSQLLWGR